ncbi:MAG: phytanoyl-CoA dioxygenase family protein [Candidatus Saccharibacteria bacterium]|nr:phytanoyl-CoA dioxygenase family protein [Rhodoferax sp.]
MLSAEQIASYQSNGYLVLPNFKPAQAIGQVRQRAMAMVEAFDPAQTIAIFSTKDSSNNVNPYFLSSADKVHCFFEEEAFGVDGALRQAKALSINKIGHALHDRDSVFDAFSRGPALAAVARDLGLTQPQIWQSMYIFKQPGIGGEVGWHQDATFFDTAPISVTTFWFALEDATLDNGCLWVQPGGHRGPLRERYVRDADKVRMEKLDATPWPQGDAAVALPVPAGALVVFHGLLPHYSAPNRSAHSRHAYTLHVTDASTAYSSRNWIQRGADFPVRGF